MALRQRQSSLPRQVDRMAIRVEHSALVICKGLAVSRCKGGVIWERACADWCTGGVAQAVGETPGDLLAVPWSWESFGAECFICITGRGRGHGKALEVHASIYQLLRREIALCERQLSDRGVECTCVEGCAQTAARQVQVSLHEHSTSQALSMQSE